MQLIKIHIIIHKFFKEHLFSEVQLKLILDSVYISMDENCKKFTICRIQLQNTNTIFKVITLYSIIIIR